MNQEKIKNSGIIYYECPLCSEVLSFEAELKGERYPGFGEPGFRRGRLGIPDISQAYMTYKFSCVKCDKSFYGNLFKNKKSIEVQENFTGSLFTTDKCTNPKRYVIHQKQFNKELTV